MDSHLWFRGVNRQPFMPGIQNTVTKEYKHVPHLRPLVRDVIRMTCLIILKMHEVLFVLDDLAVVASTHVHSSEHVWRTTCSDTMFVEFCKHQPPSFKCGSVPLENREDIQGFTMCIESKVSWLIIDGK